MLKLYEKLIISIDIVIDCIKIKLLFDYFCSLLDTCDLLGPPTYHNEHNASISLSVA